KFSDILATCETWCDNPPQISPTSLAKYNIFWSNAVREFAIGRASGGLLTAVNKKYSTTVLDTSLWWIFNLVTVDSTTLIIGSDTIDEIKTAHTYDVFILGGDTNAKVGSLNPWPEELFVDSVLQGIMLSTDESICNRGRRLMEFMLDNDFVLLNGRAPSDTPAQPTFDSV
ncbi:GSCOCG00011568001-RA-CDS, partial [Cotesia congregata]